MYHILLFMLMIIIDNLKSKLASSQNVENLLIKMKLLEEQNNKLASKLETIGSTREAPKINESNEIIKKDASISYNDFCDLASPFWDQVRFKKVVIETCTQEVAMENEQLRQEVDRLTKDLTQVKGKMEQTQPHQDNTIKVVKKLDEGQTMVCYVCHKEGHKSYECKVKNVGGEKKKEKNKKQTSKLSNTYTKRWTRRP